MSAIEVEYPIEVYSQDEANLDSLEVYLGEGELWRETAEGWHNYGLLCAAMHDDLGNMCVVRKDHWVESTIPSAWLVAIYNAEKDEWTEAKVLHAAVKNQQNDKDEITLQIPQPQSPYFANRGPMNLKFSVNQMYQPDGNEVAAYYQKIYSGHIVDIQQASYDNQLDHTSRNEKLAEVISIEALRKRRMARMSLVGRATLS